MSTHPMSQAEHARRVAAAEEQLETYRQLRAAVAAMLADDPGRVARCTLADEVARYDRLIVEFVEDLDYVKASR